MGITPRNWEKYFYMGSEGLGTLYERIVLDRLIMSIVKEFNVDTVLECPCFGMTGYTGINSWILAKSGLDVYVADHDPKRLWFVRKIWRLAGLTATFVKVDDYIKLPFDNLEFDMVWNFASLWYLKLYDPLEVIRELARVCGGILLISLPNKNLFYGLRKIFEKELWYFVNENVLTSNFRVRMINVLEKNGFKLLNWGYIDTPPWPDIAIRIGKSSNAEKIILPEYYYVSNLNQKRFLSKLTILDRLPNKLKSLWSHHIYWVFKRRKAYQSTTNFEV